MGECDERGKIKDKLEDMINYPKRGLPTKKGEHYYFWLNTGLQNQAVLYKITEKNVSMTDGLEGAEVFMDPNTLSEDGTASLGSIAFSEDGNYFAYIIQRSGSDWGTIHVRDVKTGKDLEDDVLPWVKFSGMSWTHDN